ncbi:hypothetical protein OAH70_06675 [Flavobacteriaceae bacterium]|nr:hypothetical protein [Flavobacteriaceae bacterium]MDC0554428.1 hypothetical protein [Flavobacteriaceae bacterium]|tara:strand:+ start:160 stop:753 length:594 start_codon:yes stop_codon:yes gene_type:complete
MLFKKLVLLIFIFLIGCTDSDSISGDVNNIKLEFIEGLNDDIDFHLNKNSEGYYELVLNKFSNQTIQRITAKLTQNNFPIQDNYGNIQPKLIEWESNLYWWLKKGDTVAQITKTYFNKFTGEITYTNLPPLINWKDELVSTINSSSYTSDQTGLVNTVIAPIREMSGDTLKIIVKYNHLLSDSSYKKFRDSTYILLK